MNDLVQIVRIYRSLRDVKKIDGTTEGYIDIQDESMRSFLLDSDTGSRSDELGLAILSEYEDIQVGNTVLIRLFDARNLPVYRSLAAYLGNGSRLLRPIGEYYLIEEDWFSHEPAASAEALNLKAVHDVVNQLSDSATMVDIHNARLHFADSAGVVDLLINVAPSDLTEVTREIADEFAEFCSNSLHREHRLKAVAHIVTRQTRGIAVTNRLHYILRNLVSILSDARAQHAVFLSAFSYDRVLDEVEALKIEYAAKIHNVLSDIQGQLLGIPAATVIVATQMKPTDAIGGVFITNVAVLLGAFIFGIFLFLLLKNQRHTLEVIEAEVARQRRQLKSEVPDGAHGFKKAFQMLDSRINHQRFILSTVGIVVGVGLFLSIVAFWMLNSSVITAMWSS